ncbi:MAG: type IV pilus secretin PilQ [Pseudomonadota bacterium]
MSKLVILLSILCCHQAAWAASNAITDVSFETLPGDRIQLAIEMEETAPEPLSFTINNPARIALDFQDTVSKVTKGAIPVGVGAISSVNVATQNERTRVVINLAELVGYDLQTNNNTLYVTLDDSVEGSTSNISSLSSTPTAGKPKKAEEQVNRVDGIDFRRGDEGQGLVIVELASASTPVNVVQEGSKIITEFVGADIEDDMIQRLDVLDFATPAKFIDIAQAEDGVRVVTTPSDSNFEHIAYQSDNIFTLELKPIAKEELERQARDKFGYTGERLSLNFQDIEVRSVLQLIADFTGLNVVVSDSVSGSLTLRLKNVPWDQALDIILKTKGLDKRKSGNVLLIAPTEEIAQQEKLSLEAKQQVKELAPVQSEFFQINYAKAADIMALVAGDGGNTILSERGTASVDQRTNTLMVNDTSEVLEEVRSLIQRLDVAVKQVLIESRIVIATDEFDKQLGARFGVAQRNPQDGDLLTSGSLNGTTQAINGETIEMNDRLNFNLPVTGGSLGGAGQLALALANDDSILELELSALQAEGKGEIISTPRVITANQKEAFIEQGVEIPYLEASSSGAATVTFKKAVLSLTVTPQITPDERIILDLSVKQDSVGEIFGGIPSIDTRELETQVLVDNGETVVLGGIFEHETLDSVTKVPFFGDLPGIGRFFRQTVSQDQKREILVFVTPKIVRESMEFN